MPDALNRPNGPNAADDADAPSTNPAASRWHGVGAGCRGCAWGAARVRSRC